jgi:hypothetical protein
LSDSRAKNAEEALQSERAAVRDHTTVALTISARLEELEQAKEKEKKNKSEVDRLEKERLKEEKRKEKERKKAEKQLRVEMVSTLVDVSGCCIM